MQLDMVCYKLVIRTSALIVRGQKKRANAPLAKHLHALRACRGAPLPNPSHHRQTVSRFRLNHVGGPHEPVERL